MKFVVKGGVGILWVSGLGKEIKSLHSAVLQHGQRRNFKNCLRECGLGESLISTPISEAKNARIGKIMFQVHRIVFVWACGVLV